MAINLLPRIRAQYGALVGVELFFEFPELQEEFTFLDTDSAIGASSFAASGVNFSATQYIVIGQPGAEKTELLQVSGTPTSTAINLVTPAVFPHNRGDLITFIPFNQITPEFSTDGVSYTPITSVGIRPDSTETYLQRASDLSTYSYKFRFKNSTDSTFSAYSPVTLATGYADNTVYSIKKRALQQLGEVVGPLVSNEFLNDALMEARRICDQNPAIFRWSFRTKFGVVIGQLISGAWQIAAPTDLRDRNSPKNILSLRMGNQNRPVTYQDRRRFNQNYLNVRHTTVATQAVLGQTTLVLASTHDLDTAGTITLANNTIGDGLRTVTYTANNRTTNTLSGIPASGTGSINRTVLVTTDIWQQATFGLFTNYTIDNALISFDVPLKTDYDGQDLKGDYYMAIPAITQDSDTFDEPFYDLYVPYLKFKIKYLKANGKIDRDSDVDWKDWVAGLVTLISQEFPGQYVNFVPDVNGSLGMDG